MTRAWVHRARVGVAGIGVGDRGACGGLATDGREGAFGRGGGGDGAARTTPARAGVDVNRQGFATPSHSCDEGTRGGVGQQSGVVNKSVH